MIRFSCVLTVCLVASAVVDRCDASLAIRLDDLAGNVIVIYDNGIGDTNATPGVVSWTGALGTGSWTVNVTTGIGAPILGTTSFPHTDLNSVNVSGTSAGTLQLSLTQTDNNQLSQPLAFTSLIGGVTGGTLDANVYVNSDNQAFSTTGAGAVQVASLGSFSGAFSGSTTGSASTATTGSGQYSLTTIATVTHDSAGQISSFDLEVRAIPEPASVVAWMVLGAIGLGLAWFKRRR